MDFYKVARIFYGIGFSIAVFGVICAVGFLAFLFWVFIT